MKKRLLSLALCLVMVFSLFPAFGMSASAVGSDDTTVERAKDNTGGYTTSGTILTHNKTQSVGGHNASVTGSVTLAVSGGALSTLSISTSGTFTYSTGLFSDDGNVTSDVNDAVNKITNWYNNNLKGKRATTANINLIPTATNSAIGYNETSDKGKTYTALRTLIINLITNAAKVYDITWKDANGTTIKTDEVGTGEYPFYFNAAPTASAADDSAPNGYYFAGWTATSGSTTAEGMSAANQDATYYPVFLPKAVDTEAEPIDPLKGMEISKELDYDPETGDYSITMEAYSTGNVTTVTKRENVPDTDYVLVLDQSNGMKAGIPNSYLADSNFNASSAAKNFYTVPQDTNPTKYYYKDGDDYYLVLRNKGSLQYKTYTKLGLSNEDYVDGGVTYASIFDGWYGWFATHYGVKTDYYTVYNGNLRRVFFDITYGLGEYKYELYFLKNTADVSESVQDSENWYSTKYHDTKVSLNGYVNDTGFSTDGIGTSGGDITGAPIYTSTTYPLLHKETWNNKYNEYYYIDKTGTRHSLGKITFEGGRAYENQLYVEDSSNRTQRNEILKQAVKEFAELVAAQEGDHRVSIIGFAGGSAGNNGAINSEILTGVQIVTETGNNITSRGQYSGALWANTNNYDSTSSTSANVSETSNRLVGHPETAGANETTEKVIMGKALVYAKTNLQSIVNAADKLEASGSMARIDGGLAMANRVLGYRGTETYDNLNTGNGRDTVVIVFSCGYPGNVEYNASTNRTTFQNSSKGAQVKYANNAITAANWLKQKKNATVYSISMFNESGEDENPLYQYSSSGSAAESNYTIRNFLETISSKYPAATSLSQTGAENKNGNFYYSVVNRDDLFQAFRDIVNSNDVVEASAGLDANSFLQDVVTNLDGVSADKVTVQTAAWNGYQFAEPTNYASAVKSVSGNTVKVSGFNFSDSANAVVEEKNGGSKLIVTISGLTPQDVGLEQHSNNAVTSGIYKDSSTLLKAFEEDPTFDVNSDAYVVEYATKLDIDNSVVKLNSAKTVQHGGTFDLNATTKKLMFLPSFTLSDVSSFNDKSSAMYAGAFGWRVANVIPGGSVYFDDDLLNVDIAPGDTEAVKEAYVENATANTTKGQYTITFVGSGIDVYCTTDSSSRWIQAKLDGANVKTMSNNAVNTRYNVPTISYTCAYGEHTLILNVLSTSDYKLDGIRVYNTISPEQQSVYNNDDAKQEMNAYFKNLHQLLVNVGQTYQSNNNGTMGGILFLDGMANKITKNEDGQYIVKNASDQEKTLYESDFAAYSANSPSNEIYLSQNQAITFTLTGYNNLDVGTKVMIGMSTAQKNQTASITGSYTGSVDSPLDMYYTLDTVDASDGASKTFVIVNNSDVVVSVTNLKITGNSVPVTISNGLAVTLSIEDDDPSLASTLAVEPVELQLLVNEDTLLFAAKMISGDIEPEITQEPEDPQEPEIPQEPETPDAPDTPETPTQPSTPSIHSIVQQIISSFVQSLFKSVSRLFGF